MADFSQAFYAALSLIFSFDENLVDITLRSLYVTFCAVSLSCFIGLPAGAFLAVTNFKAKKIILAIIHGLMGLPPVVVGLCVYMLLSRSGPLGIFGLLFTPKAMILAQVIIITPIITTLTFQAITPLWHYYQDLLNSLDMNFPQKMKTLLWDGKNQLLTAALAGFGRGIGEVGALMIVGGNIDQVTRVLTTAITLETSRGDFALALALGFILIFITLLFSIFIYVFGNKRGAALW